MMIRYARAMLVLVLAGCATALTQAGAGVRVTSNPELVRGCEFIGEVEGSSGPLVPGGTVGSYEEGQADLRLRNAAGELGANMVLLSANETSESLTVKRGEAYACPAG